MQIIAMKRTSGEAAEPAQQSRYDSNSDFMFCWMGENFFTFMKVSLQTDSSYHLLIDIPNVQAYYHRTSLLWK